jgi:hypothetical protein
MQACSPRIVEKIVVRDSVVTEVHERIVRDTVPFEVPVEIEKIVTRDTASHLENRFGESDAVVSGGFLSHTLRTKPQTIYVPIEVPVTDTVTIHTTAETIEIPVPAELTWWQKFRLKGFWWLLGGLVLSLLWIFRKSIFKI